MSAITLFYEPKEVFPDPCNGLTDKERAFVYAYVGIARFNALLAAEIAGYTGNRNTLKNVGCQVKQRPSVRRAIDELLESEASTAQESLVRIARKAQASISDCFVDDNGTQRFDMQYARETGAIDNIRKITASRTISTTDRGETVSESFSIEMYDALAADALLLKVAGVGEPNTSPTVVIGLDSALLKAYGDSPKPAATTGDESAP